MKYAINEYFHEKSSKKNSEQFFLGVEFFFNELCFSLEKKETPYSSIEDLIYFNPYKKSIDCEKTRNLCREYFLKNPSESESVNIFYLPKAIIYEDSVEKIRKMAIIDNLFEIEKNKLPFLSNIFLNTNSKVPEEHFFIMGLHESAHLFKLWHCSSGECILSENINYRKCLDYYESGEKILLCDQHSEQFRSIN